MKSQKLMSDYFFAMLKGFVAQANALSGMNHKLTMGEVREVFAQKLLKHFLPSQLSVGTGVIINNQGDQSKQTDVVIYDNRILPPFLTSENLNVFPIEAVVSSIEVKSVLNTPALKRADKNATHLTDVVSKRNNWLYWKRNAPPLCAVLGLRGPQIKGLSNKDDTWITKNVSSLGFICSIGNFSWAWLLVKKGKQTVPTWVYGEADKNFKELRRFLALLIDNARTRGNQNWMQNAALHSDWLGQYIRYL